MLGAFKIKVSNSVMLNESVYKILGFCLCLIILAVELKNIMLNVYIIMIAFIYIVIWIMFKNLVFSKKKKVEIKIMLLVRVVMV